MFALGTYVCWIFRYVVVSLSIISICGCTFLTKEPEVTDNRTNSQQQAFKNNKKSNFCNVPKEDYLRPADAITNPKIVVYKSKRQMYLFDGDVVVRKYRIALGKNPRGHKLFEGDGRTPEGMYQICKKNGNSKFYKSLGLDYPNPIDAQKALTEGRISDVYYQAIVLAHLQGQVPPWDTPLGGAIFIHGGGAHQDWTDGCIALYNSDMDEVYKIATIGTPVSICP